MKRKLAISSIRSIVVILILLPLLTIAESRATRSPKSAIERSGNALVQETMISIGARDLQLIIELTEPSVVEALTAEEAVPSSAASSPQTLRRPPDLASARAVTHHLQIQERQRTLVQRLKDLGDVRVQGSTDTILNAVIARVPLALYSEIQRLPGVKKVYFSHEYRLALDAAAGLQNAQGMWDKAGGSAKAGGGVKIGIIDTGIDIANPMFQDDTLAPPSGFPKGESNYTNKKVIVARNYISLLSKPQTENTAIDEVGHGSFVAGCAAGKSTNAPLGTISGMAPGAFLGSYKVFGTPGINDTASSAAILAAINDAVADGMNVLNLSLGGLTYVPASEDAQAKALTNAIAAGVVVVVAAGNLGPGAYTLSNPGNTADAITVGAASSSRKFVSQLRPTGPGAIPTNLANIVYIPGSGIKINSKVPATFTTDVSTLDGDGLACRPLVSGSLSGKIAFILRGTCSFESKVTAAKTAGARAAIVYDNVPGEDPFAMGGVDASTIPAVMISNSDGLALRSFLAANPATTVEIDDNKTLVRKSSVARTVSSFSSRGPSPEFNLKPDLVAVGENVYSAAQRNNSSGKLYSDTGFAISQGTSFATPMVAGAAAVIKQLFPGFTPQEIKSALATTASAGVSIDGTTAAGVVQAGGGLLDMSKASTLGAVITPSALSFGATGYSSSISQSKSLTIKNVSATADQFSVAVVPLVSGPTITLSQSSTGSVAPGGTAKVDVSIQASSPASGAFQGIVTVQSSNSSTTYRVPYWSGLYVPDSSRVLTVSQAAGGSGGTYSTLVDALAKARPGNVIEITDSGTYAAGLTLATNEEGLPLHGITIRAAAGKTPTFNGTGLGTASNFNIIGLRNVLLQGLTITGGSTGVLLMQTSASFPASVAIDHCTITNVSDPTIGAGVLAPYGGAVSITQSTISGCATWGVAAWNGAQLTLSRSTISSIGALGGGLGVDAEKSNIQILGSTLTNNSGPGLLADACSGTIEYSNFTNNTGSFGDGIEVGGGRLSIANSTFEGNARMGIGLFTSSIDGSIPSASILKNNIRSNARYGLYIYPGQSVRVGGNLIKANGMGIVAGGGTTGILTNNIIAKSEGTFASYAGTGVYILGSSSLRIINNTLFGNATGGFMESGSTAPIWNSIFNANTRDVLGFTAGDIQYSLVGDATLVGGGNITGDPKFTDSSNDNFEPASGSPALDAGSNMPADLPFLDYNQRLRIASTGFRAGDGKVDMGAIEAGSSYPLVFPLLANGQQTALGDDFTTGLAVLNTGAYQFQAGFAAYDSAGSLLAGSSNPVSRPIGPGVQLPILGFELFGYDFASAQLGAALVSSPAKMTGFFLLFDRTFKRFADGVDVSDNAVTALNFMRHQNDSSARTSYCLFNAGVNPANITASLYTTSGSVVGSAKTALIPPWGQFVFSFDGVTLASGYVRVQSDRPVAGLELFGNTADFSALGAAQPSFEGRLYFPHFAANQGFSTNIGIINTSAAYTNLTLTAFGGNGYPLAAPVSRVLGSNAALFESVSSLFNLGAGALATGYIAVQGDKGGLAGFTSFSYDDGKVQSAASVPAISTPGQKLLFSHIAHQVAAGAGGTYQTGIAMLNPFGVPVQYTMKVFDAAGSKKAEMTGTIGAGEKISRILSHPVSGAGYFTQPLPLSGGHVEVTSYLGLIGFELFFTEDFSQLASVPAQIGN